MIPLSRPIADAVEWNGQKFRLCLPFDRVLSVFDLWKEDFLTDAQKLDLSLGLLIKSRRAVNRLSYAEKGGLLKAVFEGHISLRAARGGDGVKTFDFKKDADYIFASFLMDYGIDLFEQQERLHWQKFISLFQGLSERTKIREVMAIRARKVPKATKYNAEEIRNLMELKSVYALEMSQEEQEEQFARGLDKLAAAMMKRAGQ